MLILFSLFVVCCLFYLLFLVVVDLHEVLFILIHFLVPINFQTRDLKLLPIAHLGDFEHSAHRSGENSCEDFCCLRPGQDFVSH